MREVAETTVIPGQQLDEHLNETDTLPKGLPNPPRGKKGGGKEKRKKKDKHRGEQKK